MKMIIFFLLAIISLGFFVFEVYRRYRYITIGRAENRSDRPLERWKYFGTNVLLHKKIRKYPWFGIAHGFIMWGFVVLIFSSIDMALVGLFHIQILWIGDNAGYLFIRDFFIVLVVVGVIGCVVRHLVNKPEWLNNNWMTFVILALIQVIVISELLFYVNLSVHAADTLREFLWWTHFLAIFAFLLIIPHSKHLHLVFAALNTYWHTLEPKGALQPVQLGGEGEVYGVGKLEDFTWKQLLDAFSCVKCGRCNGSCPAFLCGEQLKPKRINGRLRKYIEKKASLSTKLKNWRIASAESPSRASSSRTNMDNTFPNIKSSAKDAGEKNKDKKHKGKKNKDDKNKGTRIVGDIIEEEFLWSCTTCGACMEACPVSCEHTSKIIDIRRYIVSSAENIPREFDQVFQGIENQGSPWRIKRNWDTDYAWAKEQGIPTLAEKPDAEYLYFVGCAPFSDELALKIAIAFAKLLVKANVDFAILDEEEWCCGETARRLGNELLFQKTAKRNIGIWHKSGIKKILTTCPHCFNTLQNEYCQFGGDYEVIPHSVFLADLLHKGKLKPEKVHNITATYHDPCYLGRYNGFYNEQREILKAIPGLNLVEMPRTREDAFCCGAGGGRFWVKDKEENVISKNRAEEALATSADVICTACPFCRIVLQEEITRKDLDRDIHTLDIAEILEASL